jgi:pyruvate ferredoxin oxidoreductase gamma subunit
MFRIRFHGRGGQGMKTASRILGTALFHSGYEVQDAPRYGAERRGAPIFAYVRADKTPILERGVIGEPDLVIVADDTLPGVPSAGVLQGLNARSVLLLLSATDEHAWRERLRTDARIIVLPVPAAAEELSDVSAWSAGAAARLLGIVDREVLAAAVESELSAYARDIIDGNVARALDGFDRLAGHAGIAGEGASPALSDVPPPEWVELPQDGIGAAAPTVHGGLTSVEVRTGLWRTMRPVIDYDKCRRCVWVCGSFCPDGVIATDQEGRPAIDYEHCKGCMVCLVQCPVHAISAVPERGGAESGEGVKP